jgi:hypothetical protein
LSNVCHITNKVDELAAVVSIYDPSPKKLQVHEYTKVMSWRGIWVLP